MKSIFLTIIVFSSVLQETRNLSQENLSCVIEEEFSNLENWENFSFSGNKKPTHYSIIKNSSGSYLKIRSNSSASGLIHKFQFDPNHYPNMSWRWRVNNLIKNADGRTKSGDDYPLRIFVMFDDDSAETSFWTSIRNSAVKLLYGTEPPESSLCFVWSNIIYDEAYFDNPYSETVKIIPIEMGENKLKKWHSYTVNISDQFRKIYGRSCPTSAKIAVMSDTDNTKSNVVACLDFIQIRAE